jgi:fructose-1,6-bisphosphatase II / sedoheptulose-1,7-bisphosphatase
MQWSELAYHASKVTEAAAIACYEWIGKGDGKAADKAAVDAMRTALNNLPISGRIVIGEGERDSAPMLYIGEEVGSGGIEVDIAVDPLEGTNLCADAAPNAITVLAMAMRGDLLHAPDIYMDKIAVGNKIAAGIVRLDAPIETNIKNVAIALNKPISEVFLVILDRPRHEHIINNARLIGAKVQLISDGDVCAILEAANPANQVDIVVGIGGAPEGVIAAAALRCMGGEIQGRLIFENQAERERAALMGITSLDAIFNSTELARNNVIFAASGVTNGSLLSGVKKHNNQMVTNSLIMDSTTKMQQYITTHHHYIHS